MVEQNKKFVKYAAMKLAFPKEYDDNIGSEWWKIFQKDFTAYQASKYILQNSVDDNQKIWGKIHFDLYVAEGTVLCLLCRYQFWYRDFKTAWREVLDEHDLRNSLHRIWNLMQHDSSL